MDKDKGLESKSDSSGMGEWVVSAPATVPTSGMRRQIRLLNVMTIEMFTVLAVGFALLRFLPRQDNTLQVFYTVIPGALAVLAVTLILNRKGLYRIAALLFSGLMSVALLLATMSFGNKFDPWPLIYMVMPLTLASIYLTTRQVTVFFAVSFAAICALPFFFAGLRFWDLPIGFYAIAGMALMIIKYYRETLEGLRQAELEESHARYKGLLENVFEGIAIERDGLLIETNQGFAQIFGMHPSEMSAKELSQLIPAGLPEQPGAGVSSEVLGLRKDGSRVFLEFAIRPLGTAPNAPHMIAVRDITEKKTDELERARLHTAIEQAAESVIITGPDQLIQYVNPAFTRMTGYTAEEALGRTPFDLGCGVDSAELYNTIPEHMRRCEPWQGRFVNRHRNGNIYETDITVSPVIDVNRRVVDVVAVARDVTREVQLEAQYRQSQKMEAVGQLASGIAHDFNNLIHAVRGYAEIVKNGLDSRNPYQEDVNEIIDAADRAGALVQQLLMFSRTESSRRTLVNLNDLISNLLRMLQRVIGEHVELSASFRAGLPPVHADKSQIEHVLINLVVNARDAMPGGGTLRMSTRQFRADAAFVAAHEGAQCRDYAVLKVEDTGHGMPPSIMEHVFEPFFTTKEVGKGTGLGLATVYGIILQHEGVIDVESTPGKGTTFTVYLPAAAGEIEKKEEPLIVRDSARGGNETVLIAEDDEIVRRLEVTVLEQAGYRVLQAADGEEALALFMEQPDQIDAVVLDVIMPRLNGSETGKTIRKLRPDMPVIFASGHDQNLLEPLLSPGAGMTVLRKPYQSAELLSILRDALDAAKSGGQTSNGSSPLGIELGDKLVN